MSKIKVTVVMPVYNREKYIEKAITSVLNQTLKKWKMLIINDGSTDATADIIEKFTSDKRIQHVKLPKNQGTGNALQTALNMIDTRYFVIVDSDDWIEPQTLEVLLNEMEKQPKETSLVYSNTIWWHDRNGELERGQIERHQSFRDKYDFLLYRPMVYPRFFRTKTVRKVGGFTSNDPYNGRYAEDRYLLLRLIAISHFHWVDENLYNLRIHDNNITQGKNRMFFADVLRYMYSKLLKEWGDQYQPVYDVDQHGWFYIKELKPIESTITDLTPLHAAVEEVLTEKVTVVMPVFNREKYIENAIVSVLNQTLKEWKMLIINDASTDATADIIEKFTSDKRMKHVTLPTNQGTGKALQTALSMVDTPYFVIVDSDDWIHPQTLEVLLNEMEKQPKETSLIFSNTIWWHERNGVLKRSHIERHRSFEDKYNFLLYRPMVYPRFFRTETVRQVGGFQSDDPYNGRYAEDRYLLLRLIAISHFHWVDANLYNLRIHDNNITQGNNRIYFADVLRYMYTKLLKEWGDQYQPEFDVDQDGWLFIKELHPIQSPTPVNAVIEEMPTEKVTVVMAVYNREKFVEQAITSVLNQTLKEWKMMIINDGSTDTTADIIETFTSDKRIQHVRLSKNQGTGIALQTALSMIDTPYFVIVDSDDWIEPQTLEVLLNEMEKQPKETSLIYSNTVIWREREGVLNKLFVKKHRSFQDKYDYLKYGPMVYPRFFRTEAVRQVGGFENNDPYQGRFEEDRYLLLKLIGMSHFHCVDEDLYNCRSHGDNTTQPKNRKYFAEAKRYIFTKILKEWGDYEPVFEIASDGWLYIKELKSIESATPPVQAVIEEVPTEKVTVVMPVYNREKYIEKAITSVLNQTLIDWKMVIMNDGSTDSSAEIIERFTSDKRIQHVRLPKNLGTGKSLQTALSLVDTPYFVIVDSDDWIEPQALEVLLNEMEKQPKETSLIYSNTVIWKVIDGELHKLFVQKHRSFQDKYEYLMYGPMVYPRFFRTEAVRQVGGFENDDPYQGRFEQDRYLLLKLIGVSHFHCVDEDLYNCLSHGENSTQPKNRKYYADVKRYIFTKILNEWGDYDPVFEIASDGWLYIKELRDKR
ncbi:glycosyltransferase [Neobacillus drentensis]|uniref:glycosyltransferase family 2 protein n=1 Tax=Neobacillus drentensis TaxID=220684 RepID=UPI003000B64D